MKKVLFGMALTIAAVTTNAQQIANAKGETAPVAATNVSRTGAASEEGKNLQTRITRVLALDFATSNKIGEVTADYYQKALGKPAAETATLKTAREEKFKAILGADKYAQLEEYRAKLRANQSALSNERGASVDKVLLD
jgi:hypothetical protein